MTSASRPTKSFLLLLEVEGRSKWDIVVKAWFNGDRELAKSGSLDAARYNVMEGTRDRSKSRRLGGLHRSLSCRGGGRRRIPRIPLQDGGIQ